MSTPVDAKPQSNVRRSLFWTTVLVLGVYVVLLGITFVWAWPRDSHPDGQCEGIGFGCTPTPRDGWVLVAMLSTPFAVIATAVAWMFVGLAQLVPRLRRARPFGLGLLAATPIYLTLAAIALLNLAG